MAARSLRLASRFLLASVSGSLLGAVASPLWDRSDNASMARNWSQVPPSTDLQWTPCFDKYTCAQLQVPLDYDNPSLGTTTIAYLRSSASSPPASEPAQDILIHPGGPGGSGVGFLLKYESLFRQMFGTEYNIVGFDPRGVNNIGISVDCFTPDQAAAQAVFDELFGRTVDSRRPESLEAEFAMAGAYGDWCTRTLANSSAPYANTVNVARDMLTYAENREGANGGAADDAQLWYYGVSYGTVLGATYASLFPDRIGRMVLDGVDDIADYYSGQWKKNILDADKVVEYFFQTCHDGGPKACPSWASTPQGMESNLVQAMERLRNAPIPVSDPAVTAYPQLATYELFNYALLQALYTPMTTFPVFAQIFADIQNGNGSSLNAFIQTNTATADVIDGRLFCLDAAGRNDMSTMEQYEAHVNQINGESRFVADSWSATPLVCRQMHLAPPPSQQVNGTVTVPVRATALTL